MSRNTDPIEGYYGQQSVPTWEKSKARLDEPPFGRCECNPCEHRCVIRALREENARLQAERDSLACEVAALRSGRAIEAALAAVVLRTRERDEVRAELERLRAALREWREGESSPDCVACCVLDASLTTPAEQR